MTITITWSMVKRFLAGAFKLVAFLFVYFSAIASIVTFTIFTSGSLSHDPEGIRSGVLALFALTNLITILGFIYFHFLKPFINEGKDTSDE